MTARAEAERRHLGSVVLVRHGRPELSRKVDIDWLGYRAWWAAYGESGLASGEAPPAPLMEIAGEADLILASPLPRATETAAALSSGRPVLIDDLFVEAPLPAPPIPFVRLKPGLWNVLSRALWWLGYAAKGESRRHAKARARLAAGRLAELARGRRLILLCGHGWFNRMTRKVLRQQGWRCVYDGGDNYWAHRRYEPPGSAGAGRNSA